jgi:hypothetical protein
MNSFRVDKRLAGLMRTAWERDARVVIETDDGSDLVIRVFFKPKEQDQLQEALWTVDKEHGGGNFKFNEVSLVIGVLEPEGR